MKPAYMGLALAVASLTAACGDDDAPRDGGVDSGTRDAGADGATPDSGPRDAPAPDATTPDATTPDGGASCAAPNGCPGDPRPTVLWAHDYAGTLSSVATLHLEDDGAVVFAGALSGETDFGAGSVVPTGMRDLYFARLDATGTPDWAQVIVTSADDVSVTGVARDATGNFYLSGWGAGTLELGSGPIDPPMPPGSRPGWLAKLGPTRALLWLRRVSDVSFGGVVLDSMGRANVLASFNGTVDFGGSIGSFTSGAGGADLLLLAYDDAGALRRVTQHGEPDRVDPSGVLAVGPGDDLFIASSFSSSTGEDQGLVVERLDSAGGSTWRRRFGTTTMPLPQIFGLDVGPTGSAVIVGRGFVDLGDGVPAYERWVARFDADGMIEWQHAWNLEPMRVAVDDADHAWVTGNFSGPRLDLDPTPCSLGSMLEAGPFLFELDATGARISSAGVLGGNAVAVDARSGRVAVGGRTSTLIDHGCGSHAAGFEAPFVVLTQ